MNTENTMHGGPGRTGGPSRTGGRLKLLCLMVALLVMMLSTSCVVKTRHGDVGALGGKGAWGKKDADGNAEMLVWNNEDSFRVFGALAAMGFGAWQAVATQQAVEGTARVVNTNATNQAINASNNLTRVETAGIAAGVEKAKLVPR